MSESVHLPLSESLQELIAITGKLQADADLLDRCISDALKRYHQESTLLNNANVSANFVYTPPIMSAEEWYRNVAGKEEEESISPPEPTAEEVESVVEAYKEELLPEPENAVLPDLGTMIHEKLCREGEVFRKELFVQEDCPEPEFEPQQESADRQSTNGGLIECRICRRFKARRWMKVENAQRTDICLKCADEPRESPKKKR